MQPQPVMSASDVRCVRCGYDLRTTADNQPCPECGLLAIRSRQVSAHLDETTPAWLGRINVGLIVPPKEKWPGGNPKENDLLQLRVTAPSLGFNYYWANFKYIKRIDYGSSLVQTFANTD